MEISALSGLGITAGVTGIVAGWKQINSFAAKFYGIFVVTIHLNYGDSDCTKLWIQKNSKNTKTKKWFVKSYLRYFSMIQFVRPKLSNGRVIYEDVLDGSRIVWRSKIPFFINIKKPQFNPNYVNGELTIKFFRGTANPDELITEINNSTETFNTSKRALFNRFFIYKMFGKSVKNDENNITDQKFSYIPVDRVSRLVSLKADEVGEQSDQLNPINRIAMSYDMERVIDRIKAWYESQKWYRERQIPWRLGCLFYGKPGTGKTSLVKAIAQELSIPIYSFDLSTMDNIEFQDNYKKALTNTPCVILIEDIDSVFKGRENIASKKGTGLSFDCLLNSISGIENSDGTLLVITTNNIDSIDPALGSNDDCGIPSRPGRIDCTVEFSNLDERGRTKIASRIMKGFHESWVEYLIKIGDNDTGAQFEDRCTAVALKLMNGQVPYYEVVAPDQETTNIKKAS